ncbi:MAG: hypothetical protein JWM02_2676 [Frankiales bacterium]|nr:hypothetical protein [Frankiales bacterium]
MVVDARPAPVVTIVDPAHPGPLVEVANEPAGVRSGLSVVERLLSLAVVVLLVAGTGAVRELQDRRHLRQLVEGLRLAAVVTSLEPAGGRAPQGLLLDVAVSSDRPPDVTLDQAQADRGWVVVGMAPSRLEPGSPASLLLERDIDCSSRVLAPESLTLQVTVSGARPRTLELPLGGDIAGVALDTAYFCGNLDAVQSLVVISSSVTFLGTRGLVVARLADVAVADLVVEAVNVRGFTFRPSRPLPLRLQGRAPGALRRERLASRELTLDARVTDCGAARVVLDAAERSDTPDEVDVLVRGRGGRGLAPLDIRGVEAFLANLWQITCG